MNALKYIEYFNKVDITKGIKGKLLAPVRRVLKAKANRDIPKYLSTLPVPDTIVGDRIDRKLIVSLTSFPARINDVWIVVKTMMLQTYTPDKIILWLSEDQFPDGKGIPESLKSLEGVLFEIRLVKHDIRSHKKYYYVFQEYPNDLIVTLDDDIFYPQNLLEGIVNCHKENPDAVVCNYGLYVGYNVDGSIKSYNSWNRTKSLNPKDFFFGSGGGTLFQPSKLYKDVTNIEIARLLAPTADDVWLNAMVRLANLPLIVQSNNHVLSVTVKNDERLCDTNVSQNQNDIQINAVINHYMSKIGINPFAKQ